jgi:hypothetical protein
VTYQRYCSCQDRKELEELKQNEEAVGDAEVILPDIYEVTDNNAFKVQRMTCSWNFRSIYDN